MYVIRAMRIEDVETVAKMVALDHDPNLEKGYKIAKEHTLDHLKIVPQHCYVVEDDKGNIIGAMILHPQDEVFEIEDFHIKNIQRNKEALKMLKEKLMKQLENVETEVLCCPYALKGLIQEI
ncbi:hypothetical protein J7K27_02060 [Candidatus Bathyarchaeota archaeon]|nr:hypothetical protein [Candidatus Bathyarchaeota archaeon]